MARTAIATAFLRVAFLALLTVYAALGFTAEHPKQAHGDRERFEEELLIKPLPDGHVLLHFHFTHWTPAKKHHQLFPRAADQLSQALDFEEAEVSFTRGRWDNRRWGDPAVPAKPMGAELIARFPSSLAAPELPSAWGNLTHAFSGLLCSSLNFLERSEMVALPEFVFKREAGSWVHGLLPKEAVCTENLTPWLKLLPCGDSHGLAALMDRHVLYSADYHSLHTHIEVTRGHPSNGGNEQLLTQTLTLVVRGSHGMSSLSARPSNWSLSSIMASPPKGACAVASQSQVYVQIPGQLVDRAKGVEEVDTVPGGGDHTFSAHNNALYIVDPAPNKTLKLTTMGVATSDAILVYDLEVNSSLDPAFSWRVAGNGGWEPRGVQCEVHTYIRNGQGESGGLVVEVGWTGAGSAPSRPRGLLRHELKKLCLLQTVPWFVRVWIHTMRMLVDGQDYPTARAVYKHMLGMSQDRKAPAMLELCLQVPATASSMAITVDFTPAFLSVTEHPPDAHRGFDIPPALVTFPDEDDSTGVRAEDLKKPSESIQVLLQLLQHSQRKYVYSQGTLVSLATPDFSMPYNVCCLTSTVLAIYIGAMLKALVKRTDADETNEGREWRKRLAGGVLLMILMMCWVLYMDPETRAQLVQWLTDVGILHVQTN
ncbi:unnamed protein product [Ostreobium quekettii]|uniref:GPI transamidase component PIG-T n=1 Tax=Ostreobium quekettii TaxID=121088 RepID=A0A8S1IZJ2_9CHLO|nr:unnamed protein product [Ostreobium quekettii]|eukprot:evm.model.scf_182.10 EVM.evm.TU.scf_182.10   scf_182:93364-99870(-)